MLALVTGVYEAIHAGSHRKSHDVTVGEGAIFPFCGRCHEKVMFKLVRSVPVDRIGSVSFGVIEEPKGSD